MQQYPERETIFPPTEHTLGVSQSLCEKFIFYNVASMSREHIPHSYDFLAVFVLKLCKGKHYTTHVHTYGYVGI